MNTRLSSVISINEQSATEEVGAILREIEENDRKVIRSKDALKALDNKGVTVGHFRRANKMEESFLNGLGAVCKYLLLANYLALIKLLSNAGILPFSF